MLLLFHFTNGYKDNQNLTNIHDYTFKSVQPAQITILNSSYPSFSLDQSRMQHASWLADVL